MEAMVEFKHPLFSTLQKMATSIEAVRVLANTILKILTRATEKTKSSWTYMRENRVDSPYLFLHWGFSMVASPEYPELMLEKKCLKRCGPIP